MQPQGRAVSCFDDAVLVKFWRPTSCRLPAGLPRLPVYHPSTGVPPTNPNVNYLFSAAALTLEGWNVGRHRTDQ